MTLPIDQHLRHGPFAGHGIFRPVRMFCRAALRIEPEAAAGVSMGLELGFDAAHLGQGWSALARQSGRRAFPIVGGNILQKSEDRCAHQSSEIGRIPSDIVHFRPLGFIGRLRCDKVGIPQALPLLQQT